RPRPQRRGVVGGLPLRARLLLVLVLVVAGGRRLLRHPDRERDVVGVLAHQRTQLPAVEELVLALLQVQDDGGATRLERGRPERVLAAAVAFPLHPGLGRGAGAARSEERRVGRGGGAGE